MLIYLSNSFPALIQWYFIYYLLRLSLTYPFLSGYQYYVYLLITSKIQIVDDLIPV